VALVRERCVKVVKGNHDLATVDLSIPIFTPKWGKTANAWTFKVLTAVNRCCLAWLPFRHVGVDCTIVHASPESPFDWEHVSSVKAVSRQFQHFSTPGVSSATLMSLVSSGRICGHIHFGAGSSY